MEYNHRKVGEKIAENYKGSYEIGVVIKIKQLYGNRMKTSRTLNFYCNQIASTCFLTDYSNSTSSSKM